MRRTTTRGRWFIAPALVFGAALLLAPGTDRALAGDGSVADGKASISVYFTYDETDANLEEDGPWHNVFKEASKLLYNSTEGQLQIGKILVFRNCPVSLDRADFVVLNDNSGARAHVQGLGTLNRHIWISQTHKSTSGAARGQFGCVHEWGHYHFGLRDEYIGEKRRSNDEQTLVADKVRHAMIKCVQDSNSAVACIMDGGTTIATANERTEFCTKASDGWAATSHYHGGAAGGFLWWNKQAAFTGGKSCWETMAENTSLTYPTAAPSTALPANHTGPSWEVIDCRKRVVACIDRSGSMSSDDRLGAARSAARLFTYFLRKRTVKNDGNANVTVPGDEFGVTSFDSRATVNYQLQEMVDTATLSAARGAISGISLGGSTSIGGGLRVSLNQILGFDRRVSGEAIILLSDGQHNSGESPSSVIPDLRARGVKVHSIALGSGADQATLQSVAMQTGGQFFYSGSVTNLARIFLDLQARTEGGQLVFEAGAQTISPDETQDREIEVDSFTRSFTLVFSAEAAGLDFRLVKPDGNVIDPDAPGNGVERLVAEGVISYRVSDPELGTWIARVVAPPSTDQGTFGVTPAEPIADYQAVTSDLSVPGQFQIANMAVDLDLTHTYIGDLTVTLRAPSGTSAVLHQRSGGSADDLVGSYPSSLTPRDALGIFSGEQAGGTWTLEVYDGSGGSTGTLNGWGLRFYTGIADATEYTLQAFSSGPLIQVTPEVSDTDVAYPAPVIVRTTVVAQDAVAGAEVTAFVDTPDGETIELPMFDDGLASHGDETLDDGTYSVRFNSYTVNGTYRMRIRVRNEDGYPAPGLEEASEDGADPVDDSIDPFERFVTQEFRVSGVPTVRRTMLCVDKAAIVQGRAERDSLKLVGHMNCPPGDIDPANDSMMLTFGAYRLDVPAGEMKAKGKRGKWVFRNPQVKLVLDLNRGGSSLCKLAVKVKKTDLDTAVDPTFPVAVRLAAGSFDETVQLTMQPNPKAGTGAGYKINAGNITPAELFVDVFALKRKKKPGKDRLVTVMRHPSTDFDPSVQEFVMRLGGFELRVPAGTLQEAKRPGLFKGKLNLADLNAPAAPAADPGTPTEPPDTAALAGLVKIVFDTNARVIRIDGKKLDLADLPNPLIMDVELGWATFRVQLDLSAGRRSLTW